MGASIDGMVNGGAKVLGLDLSDSVVEKARQVGREAIASGVDEDTAYMAARQVLLGAQGLARGAA